MSLRNKVILIGHLGKAPEVMQNESGMYGYFNIATPYAMPDGQGGWKDGTDWHHCQFNDALAKRIEKLALVAGDMLAVEGRLTYQKKDECTNAVIKVAGFDLLKRKEPKATTTEATGATATGATTEQATTSTGDEDDLPF